MKLADISIRQPVFALMMSLALVTLGLFSYRTLGVDLMPKTELPVVNVRISLPGASAEEVENQLTKPIEEAVNTIDGIDELRTTSNEGFSNATITFVLEKDIDKAVQDVRDKVAPLRFPRDASPPVVGKFDPDAGSMLTLGISGDRNTKELTQIVDEQIKQVIESAPGVASVDVAGDRRRQIQLLLDAARLSAYGLTVDQVRNAVDRQNVEIPGGTFISGQSEIALRTMGRLQNVSDFNNIIISQKTGSIIRFSDVGRVVDGVDEPRSITKIDGRPAISLSVTKQAGTNTIAVADAVMARVENVKRTLPPDLQIVTRRDQSQFIRKSVNDIEHHLIFGGLLASLVVFFFLRNIRTTFIAAVAIPVSIIGTFSVLKIFDFTLNNMTLLALSLATGIVIDDAIVVLENIFRYVEEKHKSPAEAASAATDEIGLAVVATTLSLVVIFLPVLFITGQIGQYFYSFGITSAAAILISMFVSFTLTPALASMWLRQRDVEGHGATASKSRGIYAAVDRSYGRMLRWCLHHRPVMVAIAVVVAASAVLLFPRLGKELVPDDDQSEFNVNVNLTRGTTLQRTVEYVQDLEGDLQKLPAVQTVFTNINPGGASYYVGLKPLEERSVSQQEVMRQARLLLRKNYPSARTSVSGGTDISGASTGGGNFRGGGGGGGGYGGNRLSLLIQGPEIDQLQTYTLQLVDKLDEVPGFVDVSTNFEPTQQELRVETDRVRASDLGVSIDSLASNLRTLVGGEEVTKFKDGDDQYSVILRLDEQFRDDPAKLGDLLIPSATQKVMRVSDVAQLHMGNGPNSINRYNRQRQISVNVNLDNVPIGDAVAAAQKKVDELNMKPGYSAIFTGNAKTLASASSDFVLAALLAVAFIYMVLASQFNSFIHPFTIMTALPLSLPAGLLALMAFGMTINVYSAIGLMMLFGIVKKNSILQVDYTNTLRETGMERHEALLAASHVRLRPILMTTISIIAGMLPIAFGRGSGAGSRASMAVTIIGGQVLCLLLTLLITPVVYSYFDDLREWRLSRLFARFRQPRTSEPQVTEN